MYNLFFRNIVAFVVSAGNECEPELTSCKYRVIALQLRCVYFVLAVKHFWLDKCNILEEREQEGFLQVNRVTHNRCEPSPFLCCCNALGGRLGYMPPRLLCSLPLTPLSHGQLLSSFLWGFLRMLQVLRARGRVKLSHAAIRGTLPKQRE